MAAQADLVCLVRVAIVTMLGTPAEGTVTVANARDWFKVSVTWNIIINHVPRARDGVTCAGR